MLIKIRNTVILVLLVIQAPAFAREIKIEFDSREKDFQVLKEEPGRILISSNISTLEIIETIIRQDTFLRLHTLGYTPVYQPGTPEVLVRNQLIEFPPGSAPSVKIISWQMDTVRLQEYEFYSALYPSRLSPSKRFSPESISVSQNTDLYHETDSGILPPVQFTPIGSSRGTGIGMLTIAPFRYYREKNILIIMNNLVFEISWPLTAESNYKSSKSRQQSLIFNQTLKNLVYSSLPQTIPLSSTKPVKYVILSDTIFRESLQPFIEWKTKKGFEVLEFYRGDPGVGHSVEEMKSSLKELYDSGSIVDPPPLFLLIAGDVEYIPPSQESGQLTDLYYAEYDGNGDYLPELFYGRFSAADTTQMKILVEKSIRHEQFLFTDPSFLNHSVLIAGADGTHASRWGNGQVNYMNRYYLNQSNGNKVYKFLYPDSETMADSIRSIISMGASLVNYTGHGYPDRWDNPRFSKADIPELQNLDKYPLMIGNGCSTATFDDPECLAEALVRAEGKGALAYIGCTNDSYWDEDYYWAVGVGPISANPLYNETGPGVFDKLYHEHEEPLNEWYPALGQILHAGNLAVMTGNIERAKYYWEIYHLFGDPSLIPYLSVPAPLLAKHPSRIHKSNDKLSILTEPYAYAAISRNNELLDARYASDEGLLVFEITDHFLQSDSVQLTITGQNRQPHMAEIILLADSVSYPEILEVRINDSEGNNDGKADYGEKIGLSFVIANRGSNMSDSLEFELFTQDPNIYLPDIKAYTGPVNPQAIFESPEIFPIRLSESLRDGSSISWKLNIRDQNGNLWDHFFNITVQAPAPFVENYSVDDRLRGNGNGILDPGEQANLTIKIRNNGSSTSGPITGLLNSLPGRITVTDSLLESAALDPSEGISLIFEISADSTVQKGSRLCLPFSMISSPYVIHDTLLISVGKIFEDFESGSFSIRSWKNDSMLPWHISEEYTHRGFFSSRSGLCQDFDTSFLSITVHSLVDDSISFYFRVSSEPAFDYFGFLMDGEQIELWSGEQAWQQFTHPVPAGKHLFQWMYYKDKSLARGADAAWIDFIEFPEGSFQSYNPGIMEILSPVRGQVHSHLDSVKISIRNYGTYPIDSLPLTWIVNDTLGWNDTLFYAIQPKESREFTFRQPVRFHPGDSYRLKTYVGCSYDEFRGNDTLEILFINDKFFDAGVPRFESLIRNSANFRDSLSISAWIKNEGTLEIENMNLNFFRDDMLLTKTTVSQKLPAGDSMLVTGRDSVLFFEPGPHKINVSLEVPFDVNPKNDSLSALVWIDTVRDARIAAINSPDAADSIFTDSETVSVLVCNDGNFALPEIPLTLQLNGIFITQNLIPGILNPSQCVQYSFESTCDLSPYGKHELIVFSSVQHDRFPDNNLIRQQLEHRLPTFFPGLQRETDLVHIFPNPSTGEFRIRHGNAARGSIKIMVHNTAGRIIYYDIFMHSGGDLNTVINLEGNPEGLYLLKVISGPAITAGMKNNSERRTWIRKLVLER